MSVEQQERTGCNPFTWFLSKFGWGRQAMVSQTIIEMSQEDRNAYANAYRDTYRKPFDGDALGLTESGLTPTQLAGVGDHNRMNGSRVWD
jgi:hypothetical protein